MLLKNMIRKIKKSFGRYASIFLIIFIGIGFWAGISAASDDIRLSLDKYYKENELMDISITSATGFTKEDKKMVEQVKGVSKAVLTYSYDLLDSDGKVVRVNAMENGMNQVQLTKGKIPKTNDQVLADEAKYQIGDRITFQSSVEGILKEKTYTVCGLIKTPLYTKDDYGTTTIGNGQLSSFLYVKKDDFALPVYTQLDLLVKDAAKVAFYDAKYQTIVRNVYNKVKELGIKESKVWYVTDRNDFYGYKELQDSTYMINKVAIVLPVFFILIVILMTSNTMARMILEERLEMGTMSSLGYHNIPITLTYLGYVLSATVFGSISGFFIGSSTIPIIIQNAFQKFRMPSLVLAYSYKQFALLLIFAVLLMSLVTIFFCWLELRQIPAHLLRPVPPKKGRTIALERLPFLWKRLNFTWKVTIRNMFRYKQRVFMMIVGVAGCSALLLTGFGLRTSIFGMTQKQFQTIFHYGMYATFEQEITSFSKDEIQNLKEDGVNNPYLIHQGKTQLKKKDKSYDAYLVVSSDSKQFLQYYHLTDTRKNKQVPLGENQVVLTERVADLLHVKAKDTIQVKGIDDNIETVKITAVVTNYIGNYIFMDHSTYQNVFSKDATYNMFLANDKTNNTDLLTKKLKKQDNILNVSYQQDLKKQAENGLESLNGVIFLIVLIAVMLSVIVLYNLTSINLSERKREIATLKVLGFTEKEANAYIYREAFFLSALSALIGLLLGKLMHLFVIHTIQSENMMYLTKLSGFDYVWALLILFVVSLMMEAVTYRKIRKIDMIDSLKSVE